MESEFDGHGVEQLDNAAFDVVFGGEAVTRIGPSAIHGGSDAQNETFVVAVE